MVPVEVGNSQIEGTESAGQRQSPDTDVEVSNGSLDNNVFEAKQGDLKRLEREDKCFKYSLDSDLRTAKRQIENYEIDFPADSTQFDSSWIRQLEDAQYIVKICKRLNEKWKKVELEKKGIKRCILSIKFKEKEVLEKFDTARI